MCLPASLGHKGEATLAVVEGIIVVGAVLVVPVNQRRVKIPRYGYLAAAEPCALVTVVRRVLYASAVADAACVVARAFEHRRRATSDGRELVAPCRDQEWIR